MLKSGLIFGVIAFILGAGITLLNQLCIPCAAIFIGLAAGGFAGVFDKPLNTAASAKTGALAGTFGGAGAVLGQMVALGINAMIIWPIAAQYYNSQYGLALPSSGHFNAADYFYVFGIPCCIGLLDLMIMAGLGAVGGLVWWQMAGQKRLYNNSAIT